MGLFSNDSDGENAESDDGGSTETVTIVKEKERSFEYTEHVAEAVFSGGSSRQFVFDEMEHTGDTIVLANYESDTWPEVKSPFSNAPRKRKVVTISTENLLYLETVERRSKEVSSVDETLLERERGEAERMVEDNDNCYWPEEHES